MKKQHSTNVSMEGKICIVTGANSGVGFETSRLLAQHGAHLVMVCRNKQKAEGAKVRIEEVAKGPVDLALADLSSFEEVRTLAKTLREKYPRINLLINNAGVFYTSRTITVDGFETVFAVNYLSVFLLTRLLLDNIKAAAPSRIVNVASKAHQFGDLDLNDLHWEKRKYGSLKSYGTSKIANIQFVRELAERLKGTGVTINCLHPGEVATNIGVDNNGVMYNLIKEVILNRVYRTPVTASANAVYYLAASPELENVSGEYFELTHKKQPSAAARDRSLGNTLWLISEQFTGLVTPTAAV